MPKSNVSHKSKSRTDRAQLIMSVPRIERQFRKHSDRKKIQNLVPVVLASAIQTILSEIIQNASIGCRNGSRSTITKEDIFRGLNCSPIARKLLKNIHVIGISGPKHISNAIIPAMKSDKKRLKKPK